LLANLHLTITAESWPLASAFTISRGSKTAAEVVVVTLTDGDHTGRGECVPYARYNESVPQVIAALESRREEITASDSSQTASWPGLPYAARNALDCALWDLRAKQTNIPAWQTARLPQPAPITTAYTLSLDTPERMAEAASAAAHMPLLKLKLGTADDRARLAAIRKAVPNTRLIIDANEGWTAANIELHLQFCADQNIELVEQPLPASADEILRDMPRSVIICADESAHGLESLPSLMGKYDAINIKLDKTGGLTPALALLSLAQQSKLKIMTGCMLATSLATAPALLLAAEADYVDLDGPLLLRNDREPGLTIHNGVIAPAPRELWG
jgi:L-Ala-D/L-Glu epimerase